MTAGLVAGRHGSVEDLSLSPGETLPEGPPGTESAVVVLAGSVSGLSTGAALFLPPGRPTDLTADADGARLLLVRAHAAERPASTQDDTVLDARGGFTDMSVRWLVNAAISGSTNLVVATSTFAPDGHHELHRHPQAEEFFVVLTGSGEHLTETGALRLAAGGKVLVPAGEWHGYRTDPGVTTTTIYGYLGAASLDDAGYEVHS